MSSARELDPVHDIEGHADTPLQRGFLDAAQRRSLPPTHYSKDEIVLWRKGLADGRRFSREYSRNYHGWLASTKCPPGECSGA